MKRTAAVVMAALALGAAGTAQANEELAKKSGCLTCHNVSGAKKMGPSFKTASAKGEEAIGDDKRAHEEPDRARIEDGEQPQPQRHPERGAAEVGQRRAPANLPRELGQDPQVEHDAPGHHHEHHVRGGEAVVDEHGQHDPERETDHSEDRAAGRGAGGEQRQLQP